MVGLERKLAWGQDQVAMTPTALPHADLFGDLDQLHAVAALRRHGKSGGADRATRRTSSFDTEAAARLLEASEDYRVLRRLKPREVDSSYRPGPGLTEHRCPA